MRLDVYGHIIDLAGLLDGADDADPLRSQFRVNNAIHTVDSSICIRSFAIVERDTLAQLETHRRVIDLFPGFCQPWYRQSLLVTIDKRLIDIPSNHLRNPLFNGLRIQARRLGANSRYQIGITLGEDRGRSSKQNATESR